MNDDSERGTQTPLRPSAGDADAPPAPGSEPPPRPSTHGRWHPSAWTRPVRAARIRGEILWSEGVRALLCMLPMLVADAFGQEHAIAPLGQAGFFMSALFLPRTLDRRINLVLVLLTLGGGFYLLGGNVVDTPGLAITFMVFVGVIASFMTAWEYGYILALGFTMIFCAGINSGSPQRAAENFDLFCLAVLWGGTISWLPYWKSLPAPTRPEFSQADYAEQGVRIGIGAATALSVAFTCGYAKLGWAPSAVCSIVRFDGAVSRTLAIGRAAGTLLGGAIALVIILAIDRTSVFVLVAVVFTILNALFKATEVGGLPLVSVPLLHTVALVLMLSADRPETGPSLALARVGTNELGIVIGLLVIFYPLPMITRIVRHIHRTRDRPREDPGLPRGAAGNPREFKP